MKRLCWILLWGLLTPLSTKGQADFSLAPVVDIKGETLARNFQSPPPEARMSCYWWWLNSMATRESITRDLEQMQAKGYGSAILIDAGNTAEEVAAKTPRGPLFMSEEWMELYKHAVREADRCGITLCVNVQSGWNPGGPSITPEYAMKRLVYSEMSVRGGKNLRIELPRPDSVLMYRDVCVQAIRKLPDNTPLKNDAISHWGAKSFNDVLGFQEIFPLDLLRDGVIWGHRGIPAVKKSEIIDLTARFDGGTLQWDAPEGEWTIIRYGWTCTGVWTSLTSDGWGGLSVDHLNPEAFQVYGSTVIEPLIRAAQEAGNSVRFLQTDSWEMGVANWTNNFPKEFLKFRGYDIRPYLPVMTGRVVENEEVSNRFLQDLRRTVSDCILNYHYKLFKELAHKNGMMFNPESGGPCYAPIDALEMMAQNDIPHGEYWARSATHVSSEGARLSVRQSACVAHTNGKRFVEAEGPTSIGPQWERSPKDLKGILDRIYCSGVNRLIWHAFVTSPKEFGLPGNEYFAGTHMNPNVTWWEQAGDFVQYTNRCSYLLQQGLFVADVLYYTGDDVPNMVFYKEEVQGLDFGYDWDKCSKDVILNRLSFSDGRIRLPDGMSYKVLVLPPHQLIDLDVLRKLEQLVAQGMTLIGAPPIRTSGLSHFPDGDRELEAIRSRLWGWLDGANRTENAYGKGRVIWGQDINHVLQSISVGPDLAFQSKRQKTRLDFIHRRTADSDIYFVTNRHARRGIGDYFYRYSPDLADRYEQVDCKFRVTGKIPEFWCPETGEITPALVYFEENGYTHIPILLNPEGSIFVVFRDGKKPTDNITRVTAQATPVFPLDPDAGPYPALDFELSGKALYATVYDPGVYQVQFSNGKKLTLNADLRHDDYLFTGEWSVSFDPQWGKKEPVVFDALKSWTEFDDPDIRYFSGKATYTNSFTLKKDQLENRKVILELGNVQELAVIRVNGHAFPVSWHAPFSVDITRHIRAGENTLEVDVVNLWPNRLIGDGKLEKSQRRTRTNILKFDAPDADKYLRVSGLLGPVRIRFFEKVRIQP